MLGKRSGVNKYTRSTGGNILLVIFFILVGSFMAMPLVYAVVSAFKPMEELFIFPPRFFVRRPTLDNFTMLVQLASNLWVPFERYLFNSVFVSALATGGHILFASMAAYPLAKHKFPGRNLIFSTVMLALLFSPQVTYLPQYILMAKIGMINSYFAMFLPSIAQALGLFLMKQFMEGIPDSTLESARIDGASEFTIFFKIVMPQVKPAWLTLVVFAFQEIWRKDMMSFIYDETLKVLPMVLNQLIQGAGIARAGVASAAGLVLLLPPVLIFVLTQSKVIETMSHSGIKG